MSNFKRAQRNRQGFPTGHVAGRLDGGLGDEQAIPLSKLAVALSSTGAIQSQKQLKHGFLGFFGAGPFGQDQYFPLAFAFQADTLPSVPDSSLAISVFAPSATTHFYLVSDVAEYLSTGTHLLCTVTFAAHSRTGTFAWNGSTLVNVGDTLWLVCDNTPDPILSGVEIIFAGDLV